MVVVIPLGGVCADGGGGEGGEVGVGEGGREDAVSSCLLEKVHSQTCSFRGRNSSVGSVLGSLSCVVQRHGFDPALSLR